MSKSITLGPVASVALTTSLIIGTKVLTYMLIRGAIRAELNRRHIRSI